jgi:hemerythrin-like metal-binding protein
MERDNLQELTIGIDEIDGQHKEFLKQLMNLRKALALGTGGRDRLMGTLRYLDEFVTLHFETEEKYMRRHHYPGILLHEKEHASFAKRYAEVKQKVMDLDARGAIMSFIAIEVEHQLEDWLSDHILKVDKKMGEYLAERM